MLTVAVTETILQFFNCNVAINNSLLALLLLIITSCCCRSIANLFGVSVSTAWLAARRVCDALIELQSKEQVIQWPCGQHALDVIEGFHSTYGFPGQ